MSRPGAGYMQGYYVGLFGRFLWLLFIYSLVHLVFIYSFNYNWFTYWALLIILSFLINTSLSMKENYPFFRHILILICMLLVHDYISSHVILWLYKIYFPELIWRIILIISFIAGVVTSFGRYGNGYYSKNIETFGNLTSLLLLVVIFVLYWWKGGLVYLFFRAALTMFEVFIAHAFLSRIRQSNEIDHNVEA